MMAQKRLDSKSKQWREIIGMRYRRLTYRNIIHNEMDVLQSSVQFPFCMLQLVCLMPGCLGVPEMGVLKLVAVSAVLQAFWGGAAGALPLYMVAKEKLA